ncbi:hypothetical protein HHK36_029116 [Tetracentron sinense]|uniref:Bidirectional sugar transporter SWEET n=1 Tax=Tetracentron sinense TaxID=13715 RepID=A0A835D0V0_TETSI|nr:hypothetical protein HHK36_029116 [Tetracentron sinense]
MGVNLRLAVGIMGNAASLLLYASPILTFRRVIRKRSTEEFSCVPYIIALLNCLLYTWYGLPVVSHKWENFPVVTINALGILLEVSFIFSYFWFSSARGKASYFHFYLAYLHTYMLDASSACMHSKCRYKMVALVVVPVILVFCVTVLVSTFAFHDHHHRKVFVGSIALVASVAMYGSPLVVVVGALFSSLTSYVMKQVIHTKSVEFMPFHLSFFSFMASSLWMTYGLLSRDLFLASPNLVGCPLSIVQLVLYCKYKKKGIIEEPNKTDLEKDGEKLKSQLPMSNDSNAKN